MMKQLLLLAFCLGLTNVSLASEENKEKLRAYSYKAFSQMPELKKTQSGLQWGGKEFYKNLVQLRATEFFALCANPDVIIAPKLIRERMKIEETEIFAGLHEDALTAKVIDNKSVLDVAAERVELMCKANSNQSDCAQAKDMLRVVQAIIEDSSEKREEVKKDSNNYIVQVIKIMQGHEQD